MKTLLLMIVLALPCMSDDGIRGFIDINSAKTTKWNTVFNYINTRLATANPKWPNQIKQINYTVTASTPTASRRVQVDIVVKDFSAIESYLDTVKADADVIKMDVMVYSYGHDTNEPCREKQRYVK